MFYAITALLGLAMTIGLVALITVKTIPEHQRGVVFRLGRLSHVRGPGSLFVLPGLERVVRVDLRPQTLEVPAQQLVTSDNVPVRVGAVLVFQVEHPERALTDVADYVEGLRQLAQTTLRTLVGETQLSDLYNRSEQLSQQLQRRITTQTASWGINVTRMSLQPLRS